MARILLADDDDLVAQIVSRILLKEGHAVGHAQDGVDALRLMRSRPPHLLILDCAMPEMDGLAVLRNMRIDADLFRIPVLMLTSRRGREDEQIARYDGANDYLTKPIDADLLVIAVETLLERSRKIAGRSPAGVVERKRLFSPKSCV